MSIMDILMGILTYRVPTEVLADLWELVIPFIVYPLVCGWAFMLIYAAYLALRGIWRAWRWARGTTTCWGAQS